MRADDSLRRANERMRQLSGVTYYVALPFVPFDDGIAPDEAIECDESGSFVAQSWGRRRNRVQPNG